VRFHHPLPTNKLTSTALLFGAILLAAAAMPAHAATIWDESTDGDLSNEFTDGTEVTLAAGVNRVLGSSGQVNLGGDFFPEGDYIEFVIGAGESVTGIGFAPTNSEPADVRLFENVNFNDPGSSGEDWVSREATDNITATADLLSPSAWDRGSLGAGQWAFGTFINDDNASSTSAVMNYDYTVEFVPTPATLPMMLGLAAPLLLRRRRTIAT